VAQRLPHSANPQRVQAQVTGFTAPGPKEAAGTVYYSYTIQGKTHQGSYKSGALQNGTPVPIYCNPSYPWLNSYKDPGPQRAEAQGWMLFLTIVYAAMTGVFMGVVSLLSLPSQNANSDPGPG